jgi:hypothetical protein
MQKILHKPILNVWNPANIAPFLFIDVNFNTFVVRNYPGVKAMARLKNIESFCSSCNTIQKMEISGEFAGEGNENKRWAKCKKCKQTMVIDLSSDILDGKVSLEGIENDDVTTYSPVKTFVLGETIYHQNWDDFGKVITKETLSNGQNSITVEFQKSGSKKLIESFHN